MMDIRFDFLPVHNIDPVLLSLDKNRNRGFREDFELGNCSFLALFPFAQHNFVESIRSEM